MCDPRRNEDEALQCLLSYSSSCYSSLLAGPSLDNAAFSRWENVRPSAEYDLSSRSYNPLKTRKRRSINPLARCAISLPNIRSRVHQKRCSESYMSGHLDENFSYVYTGGLSDRSRSEQDHKDERPMYHFSTDPLHRQGSCSFSTRTLTLEPPVVPAQMEARTHEEISRLVAMQFRPQVLAEQLLVENRLRTLQLNTFPVLGTKSENRMSCERGNGTRSSSKSLDFTPPPPTKVLHASQAQHSYKKKKQRKSKSNTTFEWCPLAIQDCSNTDLPNNLCHSPHKETHSRSVANQDRVIVQSLNETGLTDLLEIGSLASNHMAHMQLPRLTGERILARDKAKSPAYFEQEMFVVDNSKPRNGQDDLAPYRMRLPIVVPSFKQEWPKAVTLRTKAFNDRSTMLQLPPSKFATSQSFTH